MRSHEDVSSRHGAFRVWSWVMVSFFATIVLPLVLLAIVYSQGMAFLLAGKTIAALIASFAITMLFLIGAVWLAIDGIARSNAEHNSRELRLLARIGRRALRRTNIFGLLYDVVWKLVLQLSKWAVSWLILTLLLALPDKKSG